MKHYYTAYGLTISSDIPLNYLKEVPPIRADVTIKRGQLPPSPPLQETKLHRAGLQAKFAQEGTDRLWLNWSPLVQFMAIGKSELIVDAKTTDEALLSLFITSEAIGLILFQRGYFLLHGSAIQLHNKGVVFLGEPGAGKSTTLAAFANRGISIMSDDMVCIQVSDIGQPLLIPAFPQIKIWEKSVEGLQISRNGLAHAREGVNKFSWHESVTFEENNIPLEQIFILMPTNGSAKPIDEIPKIRQPIELLSHFPLPDLLLNGESLKQHFEKSITITNTTSLFKLSRPANFTKLYEFVDHLKTTFE